MSKIKNIIKEALLLNNMIEDDIAVIQVNKISFNVHLFRILVLLLYNFVLQTKIPEQEIFNYVMKNFEPVSYIVITEVEIVLLHFYNIYNEELDEEVELHNKDECYIVLAIQNEVNKKLKKIM